MNASTMYQTMERNATSARGREKGVKYIFAKIIRALSFDADAIFKSKDWPHLWSK